MSTHQVEHNYCAHTHTHTLTHTHTHPKRMYYPTNVLSNYNVMGDVSKILMIYCEHNLGPLVSQEVINELL